MELAGFSSYVAEAGAGLISQFSNPPDPFAEGMPPWVVPIGGSFAFAGSFGVPPYGDSNKGGTALKIPEGRKWAQWLRCVRDR